MALIRGRDGGGHWGAGRHSLTVASHFIRRLPCVAVGGEGGDSGAGCVGAAGSCEVSIGAEVGGVGEAGCGVAGGGDGPLPLRRSARGSALEPDDAGSAGGGGDACGDDALFALAAAASAAAPYAASVTGGAPSSAATVSRAAPLDAASPAPPSPSQRSGGTLPSRLFFRRRRC